ncbi:MAG: hypothetical protein PHT79_07805 [Syntrophomonadaceae bacterium]|nr:hypothetical protein [Syntrophomonadaceae bacterium]MDD4549644.1 hypothetical protein [Syntrophomonadaceae bacterium]
MIIAISYWQNCIAPVFDVSESLLIVDMEDNLVKRYTSVRLDYDLPFARARELLDSEVEVLICGAISQTLKMAVSGQNIKIISNVFGPLDNILLRYINGDLTGDDNDTFSFSNKRQQRKRCRHRGN